MPASTIPHSHSQPSSTPTSLTTTSRIIILGAGTFGLSTAFHLLARGYTNVTVLDRAKKLPAVDAAGTDINKVVRSCYSDIFYAKLAREAMEAWKLPMWQDCYHVCGVISVGSDGFDDRWRNNDKQLGAPVEDLLDAKAISTKISSSLRSYTDSTDLTDPNLEPNAQCVGSFTNYRGYLNPEGGWAEATRAVETLLKRVKEMGGKVLDNQEVVGLVKIENGWTTGVKCRNGNYFEGDRVILSIGSWTASTFPDLELDSKCLATGQSVAMIQLTAEEQKVYKGCYIFLDFQSGFYTFPPTEDGIVKVGIHTAGHTHMISSKQIAGNNDGPPRRISTPRTITSHPDSGDGLRIPRSALQELKKRLRQVYPELAEKPWVGTRMCCQDALRMQDAILAMGLLQPTSSWELDDSCVQIEEDHGRYILHMRSYGGRTGVEIPLAVHRAHTCILSDDSHKRRLTWLVAEVPLEDKILPYTDTPDGDWVIGPFLEDQTLFLATSGSGHAFKFLPIIGRLVVDSLEGRLDAATAARFAVNRDTTDATNGERAVNILEELDSEELCGPDLM